MTTSRKAFQPQVIKLEGREQPGSMFRTGVDMSVLAGVFGDAVEKASRPALVRDQALTQRVQTDEVGTKPLVQPLDNQDAGTIRVEQVSTVNQVDGLRLRQRMTAATLHEYLGVTTEEFQKGWTFNGKEIEDSRGVFLINYNGDFDGRSGLANEFNSVVSDARTYDGFRIRGASNKNCFLSHNLETGMGNVTKAFVHIVGPGAPNMPNYGTPNGGYSDVLPRTLYENGVGGITVTHLATGLLGFGLTEFETRVCGINLPFPQEHYWVGVQPVAEVSGSGRSFNSTASYTTTSGGGQNGTVNTPRGGPGKNDNAVFDSPYFGAVWADPGDFFGVGVHDFSIGICRTGSPSC